MRESGKHKTKGDDTKNRISATFHLPMPSRLKKMERFICPLMFSDST